MNALTLNTWADFGPPQRIPVLIQAIVSVSPDILCLQEAFDVKRLKSIASTLGYRTSVHAPESGLAVLSRFPSSGHKVHTYRAVSTSESYLRQALSAELLAGTFTLRVATTHLAWQESDEPVRAAQAAELVEWLRGVPGPVLVAGDFNAPPGSQACGRMAEAGYRDLYAALRPEDLGITWDNGNPFIQSHSARFPDRRIDYWFLRDADPPKLQAAGCRVACNLSAGGGIYPSDHYGVLAEFKRM